MTDLIPFDYEEISSLSLFTRVAVPLRAILALLRVPGPLGKSPTLPNVHLGGQTLAEIKIAEAQAIRALLHELEVVQAPANLDHHSRTEHNLAVVQTVVHLVVHLDVAASQVALHLLQDLQLFLGHHLVGSRSHANILEIATVLHQNLEEVD